MLRRFTQAVFCLIHACLLISVATCFVRPVRLDGSLPSRSSRIIISRTHSGTRSDTQLHAAAIHANKVQVAMKSQNAFRGKLLIIASKLFVSPKTYWEIVQRIWGQTYWPEVAMLVAFVNALPLSRQLFAWRYARRHNIIDTNDDDDDHAMVKAFAKSKSRKIALVVRQVGLLQAFMYGSDILWVALRYLDFAFVNKFQAQKVAGSILTVCWATYNIRRLKDHYLFQQRSKGPVVTSATPAEEFVVVDSNGDYQSVATTRHTVSNVADIFIYSCAFLTIVDLLGVELGFALKSIFGLGSFGTLALSLASKDLAAEFVGGLMIQASNFFREGENVTLQDGTKGSVVKIGWLHTYIFKKEDNVIVRVPNSQISHQRISRARREVRVRNKGGRRSF